MACSAVSRDEKGDTSGSSTDPKPSEKSGQTSVNCEVSIDAPKGGSAWLDETLKALSMLSERTVTSPPTATGMVVELDDDSDFFSPFDTERHDASRGTHEGIPKKKDGFPLQSELTEHLPFAYRQEQTEESGIPSEEIAASSEHAEWDPAVLNKSLYNKTKTEISDPKPEPQENDGLPLGLVPQLNEGLSCREDTEESRSSPESIPSLSAWVPAVFIKPPHNKKKAETSDSMSEPRENDGLPLGLVLQPNEPCSCREDTGESSSLPEPIPSSPGWVPEVSNKPPHNKKKSDASASTSKVRPEHAEGRAQLPLGGRNRPLPDIPRHHTHEAPEITKPKETTVGLVPEPSEARTKPKGRAKGIPRTLSRLTKKIVNGIAKGPRDVQILTPQPGTCMPSLMN